MAKVVVSRAATTYVGVLPERATSHRVCFLADFLARTWRPGQECTARSPIGSDSAFACIFCFSQLSSSSKFGQDTHPTPARSLAQLRGLVVPLKHPMSSPQVYRFSDSKPHTHLSVLRRDRRTYLITTCPGAPVMPVPRQFGIGCGPIPEKKNVFPC